jgi:ATP-dependent DNA helicase RecG
MVDLEGCCELIEAGESEVLEWKASTGQLSRAGETLCAFLNGHGGNLFFGVNPEGKILGQEVSDKTRLAIAETIRAIEPGPQILLQEFEVSKNRRLLVLKAIPDSNLKPYLFRGRAYQRIGSATSAMPQEMLSRLVLERPENENHWEGRRAENWDFEELEQDEIIRVAKLGIDALRVPSDIDLDPIEILRGFRLLTSDGSITNAAAVLFSRRNVLGERLLQTSLRLARFLGVDKSEFLDQNLVHGGAFHLLSEAEMFVRRHQPVAAKVVPGQMAIQQSPLIPQDALRETLINALIHRDYSNPSGEISLAIFNDRMEVRNAGRLPAGVQLEFLKKDHDSVPRNPRIANVFFAAGLIERWGRGTLKVTELCMEAGLEEPQFEERPNSFGVIFKAPFVPGASAELVDLGELEAQVLEILSPTRMLPMRKLLEELDTSERTLLRVLKRLIDIEMVERRGQGRGTGYVRSQRPRS